MARKDWDEVRRDRLRAKAAQRGYEHARKAFELAERVRELRLAQGLSQSELARRIGSTQPAIARLEAGGVAPSIDTLERIAAALEVDLVVDLADRLTPQPPRSGRKRAARSA